MIVNDKALAKVLKRSGAAGFKICSIGDSIRFVGWEWAARLLINGSNEQP